MTMTFHLAHMNYLPRMNPESPRATVRVPTLGTCFSPKMRARRARRGPGSTELHTPTILATLFVVDCYSPGPAPPRTYEAQCACKNGVLHSESSLAFRDIVMISHFSRVNYLPRMNLESRRGTARGPLWVEVSRPKWTLGHQK